MAPLPESPMSVLFFGKKGHWATAKCLEFLANMGFSVAVHLGKRGDRLPEELGWVEYDLIISFSSPWIIPGYVLRKARMGAINFHPGPPEYPGIGCTNFAIYDEQTEFGVTCHRMAETVDTGEIVRVRRFPLFADDTVTSLTDRCYHYMYAILIDVVGDAITEARLTSADESWACPPYTRRQLDELCRIEPDMSADEVRRRVRATSYPGYPGAYVELQGVRFAV